MKFIIQKADILDVLGKIQGLTGRKSNLSITEAVLIGTAGTDLKLTASDLETSFRGSYPASIESEGMIALNSRKLYEIVKEYPRSEISIREVENRWIEIGDTKILFHIVGMNPEDFPETALPEEWEGFEVDAAALKKMIDKSILAVGASDDKRAHIKGVFFERLEDERGKRIRFVSTDGSRLSMVECPLDSPNEMRAGEGVLIPKKGLGEIVKFLASDGPVRIGVQENSFFLKKNTETIVVRLLEGSFPKYGDIVAREGKNEVEIEKEAFTMMLKRMSILSSEHYKGVIFNFEENRLSVSATNPDVGEAREDMEIEYAGDPIEIAFNPRYFIETVNVIEDERIVLNLIDGEKPCLIKGNADKNFLSVIMPMRI